MPKILLFLLLFFSISLYAGGEVIEEYSFRKLKKSTAPSPMRVLRSIPKDKAIDSGLLFTYKSRKASVVSVAGDFSQWKPIPMTRNQNGVWFFFLGEYSGMQAVRYKFLVDGMWISDPKNRETVDDGRGGFVSITYPVNSTVGKNVTYRFVKEPRGSFIEFRTYNPHATYVSVAGDFNNWNPENDQLVKGADGIWRVRLSIQNGVYRYKFIVDGKWSVDLYNEKTASDGMDGIASLIEVTERLKSRGEIIKTN